ncbi:hypothetical protein QE364_003051 [Nocardioides zeae]|uniref:Uncharacterized protein n=2 Tax=Nocardioides zeae TaxID=1457234 RepID=A0ACC6IKY5_9ACTN|nr:hypothetical protein [Nocardioides zeae]MDQ1105108.1 hypothetical protein [Nocardioides zeae]MDR6175177.1 hypothetical protein [Nocardioides zeae]MDR6211330.1 hypothetical protein [Nocardioides zeae]
MKLRTLAAGAAATAFVIVSSPAFAAGPPYTVSVGGSSAAASHSVSAASSGTVTFSMRNSSGTIYNMNCSSITGSGTVTSGTGVNPIGSITSTTWTGCTFLGAMTITQNGTWSVSGTGSNATTGSETIAGQVGNVNASLRTSSNPNICRFTVTGQPRISFDEATQQLKISETGYTGNLAVSGVVGCLGALQNGNPMNMVATLNVTSPDGAINLS